MIAPFMENLDDVRDIHLKERLQEPDEIAAVLAWCVDGCLKWQKEGLGIPAAPLPAADGNVLRRQ